MIYIYSTHRIVGLDGFYITPSVSDIDNVKEDASVVYTYDVDLAEKYRQMDVVVNTIDPNTSN